MTAAQQAHLKCMELLRDRIRTHECRSVVMERGMRYTEEEKERLRKKLAACFARGMTRTEAAFECGTTIKTIVRIFGHV